MRPGFAFLAIALAMIPAAFAQSAEQNPADSAAPDSDAWTMPPDGAVHEASGTRCPSKVEGFARMQFSAAVEPNILGACVYVDDSGTGDAGIRVRRYVPGAGASRAEMADDRQLMEPDPSRGAPLFTARMDEATMRDGTKGGRITITKTRNGYLIDCFGEGATLRIASAKMALICSN